jgi:hypothetical protein
MVYLESVHAITNACVAVDRRKILGLVGIGGKANYLLK